MKYLFTYSKETQRSENQQNTANKKYEVHIVYQNIYIYVIYDYFMQIVQGCFSKKNCQNR